MLRDKIAAVYEIDISADDLTSALMSLAESETVCILDSCGVSNLGSHLLIAGIEPVSVREVTNSDPGATLSFMDEAFNTPNTAWIFTISYDLGRKLVNIGSTNRPQLGPDREPDLFLAGFQTLIVHDYNSGKTKLCGNPARFDSMWSRLVSNLGKFTPEYSVRATRVFSNYTRQQYIANIQTIKERIRSGDTYQTNLTQQLSAIFVDALAPQLIFYRLRRDHPAPFAAFIKRNDSAVVSASPERFIRVHKGRRRISTSPIKGTRPRGVAPLDDERIREQLLTSSKERAENTMIVDLLRNDLGRVCEYGTVEVEKLCVLEEHPTFFHLVSTIGGDLKAGVKFSEILKAVFPCGSITGAPKIGTMRIIDEMETRPRGLSMGAIGYFVPKDSYEMPETLDMSVAIRTVVLRGNTATFNVGGGIVIDSDPDLEYEETLIKAKALLSAINGYLE